MTIDLRDVRSSDLPVFFDHQCDVMAAEMAGFVPRSRTAFDDHWTRILRNRHCVVMTVEVDDKVAGYVSTFSQEGRQHIAYWFGREYWHRGVGTEAVARFLRLHGRRPVFGTVAATNPASGAILRRCGFLFVGEDTGPDGVQEHIFRLD